jgi:hypothetical protein
MKPIKWDTLLRSRKALPRAWDQLPVEVRRKCFVGKEDNKAEKHLSWCCFNLWRKLEPKIQAQLKEKLHYKKDVEKICKVIQKYLKQNSNTKENTMKKHSAKHVEAASDASASNSKSKSKSKKHVSKKSKKAVKKAPKSNVTEIYSNVIKKFDCPKCEAHKGHRCVYTLNNKAKHVKAGDKRSAPHRARIQKSMKSNRKAA